MSHGVASYASFAVGVVVQGVLEGPAAVLHHMALLRVAAAPVIAPVLLPLVPIIAACDPTPTAVVIVVVSRPHSRPRSDV